MDHCGREERVAGGGELGEEAGGEAEEGGNACAGEGGSGLAMGGIGGSMGLANCHPAGKRPSSVAS